MVIIATINWCRPNTTCATFALVLFSFSLSLSALPSVVAQDNTASLHKDIIAEIRAQRAELIRGVFKAKGKELAQGVEPPLSVFCAFDRTTSQFRYDANGLQSFAGTFTPEDFDLANADRIVDMRPPKPVRLQDLRQEREKWAAIRSL